MAPNKPALTALYVRIPAAQANSIHRLAETRGQAKQQVVTEIFEQVLGTAGAPRRTVTSGSRSPVADVLSLPEAAALLRVSADDVLECARTSGLPGRRIGDTWRFSRDALLGWLAEPDRLSKPSPGFAAPRTRVR